MTAWKNDVKEPDAITARSVRGALCAKLAPVLFYEVAGAGPPVVLMHAGGTDATIWDAHVAPLAERFTVLRFDARGHGRSPGGAEPFSRVDDLFAVMDAAGVARAALVGVSQGARVALEAALARH